MRSAVPVHEAPPPLPAIMHGRRASGDEPARRESATATMAPGKMHVMDDAGPRLRVALAAVDEVGGPLGAVWAIWFGSAGARTRPRPAGQTRLFHKKSTWGRAAPARDRPTPSAGPHKIQPKAVPAAFQFSTAQSSGGIQTCEEGKRGGHEGVESGAHVKPFCLFVRKGKQTSNAGESGPPD